MGGTAGAVAFDHGAVSQNKLVDDVAALDATKQPYKAISAIAVEHVMVHASASSFTGLPSGLDGDLLYGRGRFHAHLLLFLEYSRNAEHLCAYAQSTIRSHTGNLASSLVERRACPSHTRSLNASHGHAKGPCKKIRQ